MNIPAVSEGRGGGGGGGRTSRRDVGREGWRWRGRRGMEFDAGAGIKWRNSTWSDVSAVLVRGGMKGDSSAVVEQRIREFRLLVALVLHERRTSQRFWLKK